MTGPREAAKGGPVSEETARELADAARSPLDLQAVASAVFEAFLASACRHLSLDLAVVKASEPSRRATACHSWRQQAYVRQLALYLANQATGLPQAELARAIGVTRAAVCAAVREVEDRRDEPTFDALVAAIERDVVGKAS